MWPFHPVRQQGYPAGLALAVVCVLGSALVPLAASAVQYELPCPTGQNGQTRHQGGLDYRNQRHALSNVEPNHFTPSVENLVRGRNSTIGGDLDYVLGFYPNHHRALVSMTRFADRYHANRAPDAKYDVECYYKLALEFRSDDTTVRSLYASFLAKKKRPSEALAQLAAVVKLAETSAPVRYNAGLVYFEMGEYALALEQAHFALKNGHPYTVLADLLRKAGQWREPTDSATAADQPASPASSP